MNRENDTDQTIDIQDVWRVFKRNLGVIILVMLTAVTVAMIVAFHLPMKFKSVAVLNIQAGYFQNSMINDLVPGVYDASEQNAQRQSLLRQALNDAFLDKLGEDFKIFRYPPGHRLRIVEREGLLKRIEYFSVASGSFQISTTAREPLTAYEINRLVLDQITNTLVEERYRRLLNTKDAIEQHVLSLRLALEDASSAKSYQQESLRAELTKIEANIAVLTSQFTAQHPEVLKLKERADALRRLISRSPIEAANADSTSVATWVSPSSKSPIQDVFNDLIKKLNYLNVVIQMDKDRSNISYLSIIQPASLPATPFFPDKKRIAILGFGAGVLLAAIMVIFLELRRGTFLAPEAASEVLDVPLLGELPRLTTATKVKLLEGPGKAAERLLLPASAGEAN